MTPEPTFAQLAADTVRTEWAMLRFWLAHRLMDLAKVAKFLGAPGVGLWLCRGARRLVGPEAEKYRRR